jgi:leucyl/phenylalanyl-tRNA--protein transferase
MVLLPAALRVPRSLRKRIRQRRYEITADEAFAEVLESCARTPRPGQDGTWITPEMRAAYVELHRLGFAHSVEAWSDGELAGGLYGVSLGAAFFGESMFAREPDASKVAFVRLMDVLQEWRFQLVDCQVHTEHLARFGAVEWPRSRYLEALERALERPTRQGPWRLSSRVHSPLSESSSQGR